MSEPRHRKALAVVPIDPAITTSANLRAHLLGSDAIPTIAAALEGIGVSREAAHDAAVSCVQRTTNRDLAPIVVFHVAETIWRETVGDVDGRRSLLAFAESCEAGRDTLAKLLRDVREVLSEADRAYRGAWSMRERTRAAGHVASLDAVLRPRTLQQRADALVERMRS